MQNRNRVRAISTLLVAVVVIVIVVVAAVAGYFALANSSPTSLTTSSTSTTTSSAAQARQSSASSTTSSQSSTPVTFALSVGKTINELDFWTAANAGFWQQQGLQVTLQPFSGVPPEMQAAASGQVQIGFAPFSGVLQAESHGAKIKVVATESLQDDWVLIVSNKSTYTSFAQMKGATIGVNAIGAVTDIVLHVLAQHYNFTVGQDIKEAPIGGLQAELAALVTNQTQGFFWTVDQAELIQSSGNGRILLSMDSILPDFSVGTIFASDSMIANQPNLVTKIIQGEVNSMANLLANQSFAVQMAVNYLGLPTAVAQSVVNQTVNRSSYYLLNASVNPSVIRTMNLQRSLLVQLNISSSASLLQVNQTYTTQFVPMTPQNVSPSLSLLPASYLAISSAEVLELE